MAGIHSQRKHAIPINDDIPANTLVALGHSSVRTRHDLPKHAQNDEFYLLIWCSVLPAESRWGREECKLHRFGRSIAN